jgi:hypothetical protein
MKKILKKFRCPLCGSLLSETRYYQIIGVWKERKRLERDLKKKLQEVRDERRRLLNERKRIKEQMKKAVEKAFEEGRAKEKRRAERLSRMIQAKTQEIQRLNERIKELQEQLKKGTTPQIEGLNFEEELAKELKKEFPEDKIERHGKNGDIIQYVKVKNRGVGIILYECKRTDKFKSTFIDQVKKAVLQRKATYGILVTTASKKGKHGFWVEKDVFVVHPYGAIYIARVLRKSMVEIYSLKMSPSEMEKRLKELMEYVRSDEFKDTVEDTIYRTETLSEMLRKEIDSHQKVWRDRFSHYQAIQENINRLESNISSILKGLPEEEEVKLSEINQLSSFEEV